MTEEEEKFVVDVANQTMERYQRIHDRGTKKFFPTTAKAPDTMSSGWYVLIPRKSRNDPPFYYFTTATPAVALLALHGRGSVYKVAGGKWERTHRIL